ncbi:uncharacterized protein LOC124865429 isoform X2 [Girardinichthys multiradiatus]|uniref:uncharacterized protein LOC124865429 isoform X2 n=1 Tax=Girardinichthys multiradiatus TaxID=208333 RepID=UPI001FAC803F|nr:uncharacterized protein LOC124865429 isoform X2 [Girardinichthys multiradiatus]
MSFHFTSFCLLFLSLQIRDGCTVEAATLYGASGENISFLCLFHSFGTLKILCRETCEGENLLIRTSDDTAQSGRYTIKYIREASRTYSVLSVSISELTQSDSGLYRCGLGDSSSSSYQDFRLVVAEGVDPWTSTPTTAQRFISSSNVPLIVGLTLAITAVLFSAALLVSWRRRSLRVQSTAPHGTVAVVCSTDMENRGSSSGSSIEKVTYNNPAVKDLSYQNLSSDTRDQNQIYCTLTVSQE